MPTHTRTHTRARARARTLPPLNNTLSSRGNMTFGCSSTTTPFRSKLGHVVFNDCSLTWKSCVLIKVERMNVDSFAHLWKVEPQRTNTILAAWNERIFRS